MEGVSRGSIAMQLFWSPDPAVQGLVSLVLAAAGLAVVAVYAPLLWRLARIAVLRGSLRTATRDPAEPVPKQRDGIHAAFQDSPLALEWEEFLRRWRGARTPHVPPDRDGLERSPARLSELFAERPILPHGARCSALTALPGFFAAAGVIGSLLAWGLTPAHAPATGQLSLVLPPLAWGLALWAVAGLGARLLEGRFAACALDLDGLVQRAFASVSPSELAAESAHAQHESFDRMKVEFAAASSDFARTLDDGLRRIEKSTAESASLVSEEQRGSLREVVEELRVTVRRGVERHLGSLHDALERAVEHQDAVSGGLAQHFERMVANAESNTRVAESLEQAAGAVQHAASAMTDTAAGFEPVLSHLSKTGTALEETASRIDRTQQSATGAVATVTRSLEGASEAIREQRELVETGVVELRQVVEALGQGLGTDLSRALGEVDQVLSAAVDRMRETIGDSNATLERLSGPIRSAEEVTREMHAALERVRTDVGNISQWLIQAVDPVRNTLSQLDDKTGSVARALIDFSLRVEGMEKTLDAMRGNVGQEGLHLRNASADLSTRLQQTTAALESLERSTQATGTLLAEARGAPDAASTTSETSSAARALSSLPPVRAAMAGDGNDAAPSGISALLGRTPSSAGSSGPRPVASPDEPAEEKPEPGTYRRLFKRPRDN